ncbi:MAG: type II secretion system protein [Candidatus Hydrogenedentes bacterium]|nr:type II secretion system protein [Candidatus Hydrogenedentota bacterium]
MLSTIRRKQGFTLLEITLALAIFVIILGATAQVLVSYYVAMDVQRQRNTNTQNMEAILSSMRQVRDANPTNFPAAIFTQWPDGTVVPGTANSRVMSERITINFYDATTNAAATNATNPLLVVLRSTFIDRRNRPVNNVLATVLTSS